jgi:phosphoglycolate phosphatase-like HAD superfamily hydrolase
MDRKTDQPTGDPPREAVLSPGERLREFFLHGTEGAVIVGDVPAIREYIFDFDGVIFRSSEIIVASYAWLIRGVREQSFDCEDLEFSALELEQARNFRQQIKGRTAHEKILAANRIFGRSCCLPRTATELAQLWTQVYINTTKRMFHNHPRDLLVPGAEEFIRLVSERGRVFGLTAFLQDVADFLLGFVGLGEVFEKVQGCSVSNEEAVGKADMLRSFLTTLKTRQRAFCYIGDSILDVRAGRATGIGTVGIANTLANGLALLDEGCDVVATTPLAYRDVVRLLSNKG